MIYSIKYSLQYNMDKTKEKLYHFCRITLKIRIKVACKDIPSQNVYNYDETNLLIDLGFKVGILRRGTNIINNLWEISCTENSS